MDWAVLAGCGYWIGRLRARRQVGRLTPGGRVYFTVVKTNGESRDPAGARLDPPNTGAALMWTDVICPGQQPRQNAEGADNDHDRLGCLFRHCCGYLSLQRLRRRLIFSIQENRGIWLPPRPSQPSEWHADRTREITFVCRR